MKELIIFYIIIVNLIGFFTMKSDKARAKKKAWRIPEKVLFGVALLGGSLGSWIGMKKFRHKTKHWYFKFGIPFIFFLELVLVYYYSF